MTIGVNHKLIAALQAPLTREELERIFPNFSSEFHDRIIRQESIVRQAIILVLNGSNSYEEYVSWLVNQCVHTRLEADDLYEGIVSARSGMEYAIGVEDPADGLMRSLGLPPEAKFAFWKAALDVMDDEQLAEYLEFVAKYENDRKL